MPDEPAPSSITPIISHHGALDDYHVVRDEITRNLLGLDEGTVEWWSTEETASLSPGDLDPKHGLQILSLSARPEAGIVDYTARVRGIKGGKGARRLDGFPDLQHKLTDWDRAEDGWLTTNANLIVEGSVGGFAGTMICVAANPKPIGFGWYHVRASYQGIIRSKPVQRTISVNQQTVSGDAIVVNLPGGWTRPAKGQAALPKIVVRDRYYGFQPPPTSLIPGNATPAGAPPVKYITVHGVDVTRYWPGGWHLASMGGDRLADRGMWYTDLTYEWQHPFTP